MAKKKEVDLTVRQDQFLDLYLDGPNDVRGNGTKCAIAVGYSPRSARKIASAILAKDHVREEMERRMTSARHRLQTKVNDAIDKLFDLVDNCGQDHVKLNAIKDVLDRAGLVTVQKSETVNRQVFDVTDRARAILAERLTRGEINVTPGKGVLVDNNPPILEAEIVQTQESSLPEKA